MAAHKALIRRFPDEAINRTHLTLMDKIPPNVRYRQHRLWTNWAGTARCRPAFTYYPRYVEDLIQIVHFAQATSRKIRVAATGHSWSALAPTAEILVWVHQLNRV